MQFNKCLLGFYTIYLDTIREMSDIFSPRILRCKFKKVCFILFPTFLDAIREISSRYFAQIFFDEIPETSVRFSLQIFLDVIFEMSSMFLA